MTDKMIKYVRIALAVYFAGIGFLCFGNFTPSEDIPQYLFGIPMDKIAHFVMFLPFVPLTYFATQRKHHPAEMLLVTFFLVIVGVLVGAGIEYIQGLTDYRSADLMDLLADSTGVVTGGLACVVTASVLKSKGII